MKILLTEDSDSYAYMVERALSGLGYKSQRARSVAESKAMMQSLGYDVGIFDRGLWDGDASSLTCEAEELGMKAIILSGLPRDESVECCEMYINKPMSYTELVSALEEAMEWAQKQ
jgi:DNA-binding response OmpR family regulator